MRVDEMDIYAFECIFMHSSQNPPMLLAYTSFSNVLK